MKSPTSITLFTAAVTLAAVANAEYFTGDGTAYTLADTTNGNCNMMSSLSFATTDYAALNNEQWSGLQNCGRCAEVSCDDDRCADKTKSVVVQILDRCPECKHGDLDLSPSVFKTLTGSDPSRYTIKWKFVDCPVTGNVNYCLKGGSNNFWTAIQPTNVATGIKSLQINGKATKMLDGAYYYLLDGSGKASTDLSKVTVSMTDINGVAMKDTVNLSAGSCTKGTKQFPKSSGAPPAKTGAPKTNTTVPTTAPKPTPVPVTVAPKATVTPAPVAQTESPTTQTPTVTAAPPSPVQQTPVPTPSPVEKQTTDAPATDAPADTPAPFEQSETDAPAADTPAPFEQSETEAPVLDTPAPIEQSDAPAAPAPSPIEQSETDAPAADTPSPIDQGEVPPTGPISEDSSWVDVLDCDQKPGQTAEQGSSNGNDVTQQNSNAGDETQQQHSGVGGENSADSPDVPATVAPIEEGSDAQTPYQQSSGEGTYSTSEPTVGPTSSSASQQSGSTSVGGEAENPSQDANSVDADNASQSYEQNSASGSDNGSSQSYEQNSAPGSAADTTEAPIGQGSDDTLHGSDVAGSEDQSTLVTEAPSSPKDCPM